MADQVGEVADGKRDQKRRGRSLSEVQPSTVALGFQHAAGTAAKYDRDSLQVRIPFHQPGFSEGFLGREQPHPVAPTESTPTGQGA